MKHLRKFDSVSAMEAAITASEITIVGMALDNNVPVVGRKSVVTPPAPSLSTPFYIDVRGSAKLYATSGLQMSTDGENWTDTAATTLSSGKTYFRVATDQSTPLKPNWSDLNSLDYDIGGNINSLVKVNFKNDTTCYSFRLIFQSKSHLKSADNLILPATTLINSCYYGMFKGCRSLTTAPILPATTLADYCYQEMFNGCRSLTTAPILPATTLAESCYSNMFNGCSALTQAPVLPATTLAESCYYNMFNGCSALTQAPVLPATTLAVNCYQFMFYGCTSLTTAPVLPVTTLAQSCYGGMFYECTSLTTAPALPATTLAQSCYSEMFYGCTSLTTAPELPATTLAISCYHSMFAGCTNLNYIKCLAENIVSNNTEYWTEGVAETGTFVKNPSMSGWPTGDSGIPSGWTVEDATA